MAGEAWLGRARCGEVWRGLARLGGAGTARHGTCLYTSTSLGAHCSRPFHLRTNACLAEWRALESTAAAVWRGARLSSVRSRPHFCQLPVGDGVLPNVSKSEKLTVEATRSHGEGPR